MESNRSTATIVALAGGALLVLGSFLTWASVSADLGTVLGDFGSFSESVSGTEGGDGWFTLIAGAGAIALALYGRQGLTKALTIVMIVIGAIGAIVAILNVLDVSSAKDELVAADPTLADLYDVSVGIGLWAALLGGFAVVVGGFLLRSAGASVPGAPAAPDPA
jgi:hypothetical protein